MRVYVINRRKDADRRASAKEKLDAAGIRFEFFDALSGEIAVERRLFKSYDDREFLINTGRAITAGEIGCFASHRDLWVHSVELNESIMIMEDDFDLLGNFPDALRSAEEVINQVGFLRLQTDSSSARKRPITACNEFMVSRYTKAPQSTMCYCISPHVAGEFLDRTRILGAPVDLFIKKYWEHGQPLFALTPFAVAPSVLSVASTIRRRYGNKKPFAISTRRLLRKASWYRLRWAFNFQQRYLQGSPYRPIEANSVASETMRPIRIAQRSSAR